ncbi:hypothetical protein HDK90DRAFT_470502 [Phyllosticta capitalensis]|uniref:Uncharacterized protein n=2 Tax=Phyllosticta capitalensis TaxID=121624 RepID=A0ABR1YB59_9PEZI
MPAAQSFWAAIDMMVALFSLLLALAVSPSSWTEAFVNGAALYLFFFSVSAAVWGVWSTMLQIVKDPMKRPRSLSLFASLPGSLLVFRLPGLLVFVLFAIVWLLTLAKSKCLALWQGLQSLLPTSQHDNLTEQVSDLRKETLGLRTYFNAFVASLVADVTRLTQEAFDKDIAYTQLSLASSRAMAEASKYRNALHALAAKRPQDMDCDIFDSLAMQHFFGERLSLKTEVQELKRRLNECGSQDLQRHVSEKLAAQDHVKTLEDQLSAVSALPAHIEMLSVSSDESAYAFEWKLEIARQERMERELTIVELRSKLQDLNREREDSSAKLHEKADAFKDQSYRYQVARERAESRLEQSEAARHNVVEERDALKAQVTSLEEELKRRNSCCQCECPCCPLGCSAGAPTVASPSTIVQDPAPAPSPAAIPSPSPSPSPDAALVDDNALLRGQVASLSQLVHDLQLENDNLRGQGASLLPQLASADERYRQMESRVSSAEANLSTVLQQLSDANTTNAQLVHQVEQLSLHASPAAQTSPSQAEIDQARKRAEQAESKAKQLQSALDEALEEQRHMDAIANGAISSQRDAEIMTLQSDCARFRKAFAQAEEDHAAQEKTIDALKKDLAAANAEVTQLDSENGRLLRELAEADQCEYDDDDESFDDSDFGDDVDEDQPSDSASNADASTVPNFFVEKKKSEAVAELEKKLEQRDELIEALTKDMTNLETEKDAIIKDLNERLKFYEDAVSDDDDVDEEEDYYDDY